MKWLSLAWTFIKALFGGASATDTKMIQQEAEAKGAADEENKINESSLSSVRDQRSIQDSVSRMSDSAVASELHGWDRPDETRE